MQCTNPLRPGDAYTVYPKKYAHGFCFAVLCCGYTLTDYPIFIRLTSLALWQSNDCPSASKATLMNMNKYLMWIHYERLHNHNKAKHNKTVCIFLGIYCMYQWTGSSWGEVMAWRLFSANSVRQSMMAYSKLKFLEEIRPILQMEYQNWISRSCAGHFVGIMWTLYPGTNYLKLLFWPGHHYSAMWPIYYTATIKPECSLACCMDSLVWLVEIIGIPGCIYALGVPWLNRRFEQSKWFNS